MWESIHSFFWKHPGVSHPKWAPEHHRVSCTEGESSGKHSFPWINPSSHGLMMAVTPSCLKKEQGIPWKEVSGAPHLSLELWVPGLSKERPGKVCGTVLGLLLLPTECFAIPAMLWFLLWLTRHSNFLIFPALWKEQMTGNASPSRNQHAREDTGWGGCWRETWDKSLEKSGQGWGGSREG